MIDYFVARGESARLDETSRVGLRGSFALLDDGLTHYELRGPAGGELIVMIPGLTIPLFYWDRLAERLHAEGFRTLAFSAYGRGYSDRIRATYDDWLLVGQLWSSSCRRSHWMARGTSWEPRWARLSRWRTWPGNPPAFARSR